MGSNNAAFNILIKMLSMCRLGFSFVAFSCETLYKKKYKKKNNKNKNLTNSTCGRNVNSDTDSGCVWNLATGLYVVT